MSYHIDSSGSPQYPNHHALKRCSKCGEVYPATHEFFCSKGDRGGRLRSECKSCSKKRSAIYRQANREQIRRRQREYNQKNRVRIRQSSKEYYQKNKNAIRQKSQLYYWRNRDKKLEYQRKYQQEHREERLAYLGQWKKRNRKYWNEWAKRNPDRVRAIRARRRKRFRNAPGSFSRKDVEGIHRQQQGRCWWCGKPLKKGYHVDHRVPLVRGGTNQLSNLVVCCPKCNSSKGTKLPHEWNGRLL